MNVGAASIAIFLVIMAVLLWRLEVGSDPAIGTATAQAAQPQVVRRKLIIKRKLIKVKVTYDRPVLASTSTGSGSVATTTAPASSAPAASSPAPVQSSPAPAPAPAPTTSAS